MIHIILIGFVKGSEVITVWCPRTYSALLEALEIVDVHPLVNFKISIIMCSVLLLRVISFKDQGGAFYFR